MSEKFVTDALKTLDDRLSKQLEYVDEKGVERLEKSFKELGTRIVNTHNFAIDKFEDAKKFLTQYD